MAPLLDPPPKNRGREKRARCRTGANLAAMRPHILRQRLRDAAHAAAHIAPGPPQTKKRSQIVTKQDIGRAGRGGAAVGSDQAVGSENGLQSLTAETGVEQGAHAAFHKGRVERLDPVTCKRGPQVVFRRRLAQHPGVHDLRRALDVRLELKIGVHVFRRFGAEGFQRGARAVGIGIEEEEAAIGEGCKAGRFAAIDLKAIASQFQVADDLRAQEAAQIRCRRDAMAGPDLLRHARPADDLAPLQYQDALSGPRQIRRRNQPVVSRPDDDGVVALFRHSGFSWPPTLTLLPRTGGGSGWGAKNYPLSRSVGEGAGGEGTGATASCRTAAPASDRTGRWFRRAYSSRRPTACCRTGL